jgi:hypothetical protein
MGWSDKYKRSIDCNNPKGFSQKAHCAGRKIRKENMKLSELKDTIRDLIQERSVNAISKAQQKNREDIARALELYKKAKGGNKSYNEKNLIKVLKKLGQDKKKLEKEMDDKISSLYKNADYKGPIDEDSMDWEKNFKWANDKELKVISKFIFMNPKGIDGVIKMSKHKPSDFKKTIQKAAKAGLYKESVNEILVIVDKFDKRKQDYDKVYYQDGGKRPGDGDINKAKKEFAKLSKKHKGLTLISVDRNSKMYDVMDESINEGPSREEFRIAAMAIKKQAKFRNVSPEQAIQDQLNALKLLQRYIKKGDVKKYTGMNLSESKFEVGKVYDNPYHTAFKSPEQIKEEDDHEVGMGLSSLKSSVRSAKVIYDNIKKRNIEELDGWVQEKLTLASDYLKNVADYMEDLDEYDKDGNNN